MRPHHTREVGGEGLNHRGESPRRPSQGRFAPPAECCDGTEQCNGVDMMNEKAYLEDNNHTEEIDPGDETKDGEDADIVRVVQPQLGCTPEYCHHNPDLKY